MIAALRAEFRKLLSVRSTYFISFIALLLSGFLSFWVYGYKNVENAATNHHALLSNLYSVVSVSGVFLSFIAILAVGHEYRYNTIMYTLTATNRRSKVFAAKLLAVTAVALVGAALIALASVLLLKLGLSLQHIHPTAQHIPALTVLWHAVAYVVGSLIFAFMVTLIFRSLIGAFVFVLVVPSTVEQLLSLLLKDNVKYLPYTALGNLTEITSKVSDTFSLSLIALYAAILSFVAWLLFLRRDAN